MHRCLGDASAVVGLGHLQAPPASPDFRENWEVLIIQINIHIIYIYIYTYVYIYTYLCITYKIYLYMYYIYNISIWSRGPWVAWLRNHYPGILPIGNQTSSKGDNFSSSWKLTLLHFFLHCNFARCFKNCAGLGDCSELRQQNWKTRCLIRGLTWLPCGPLIFRW